jgi:hypothetical protein
MITDIYVYLTDFTITCANKLGITYEDMNALLFCVVWPLLLIALVAINMFLSFKLKKQKHVL